MLLLTLALSLAVPAQTQPPTPSWDKVVVDLSEQTATVYDAHGTKLRAFKVSSGSPDNPTPKGRFKVYSKSPVTFARSNPSVTMLNMVRFNGGVGFHAIPRKNGVPLKTPLGRYGVSHGCIRMSDADAEQMYKNLPLGASVVVRA
jgi:lipoprotein-anchoring transpeptidase ErfK/SrfK